ncbi:MAG: SDR family oxidoreductase [Candidatus Manganitrophaceae bacterium]|nr:MAG: SDR family oxidoreductase [Candidatus Manganitrophaceae bacterium]
MIRIVLVTGGNRGIGFEVCRQLSRKGMRVVLTSRNGVDGEKAAEILLREGLQVAPRPLDVTDPQQIKAIRSFIEKEFGQLDVLVNNAGVYLDEGVSLFDVPVETVRETMEVNFYAPLAICRAFIPLMLRNGYGRVVNVSSGAGQLEEMDGGTAAYKISKVALNALTRIVASEVSGQNIKVNSICPGWVRTRMGGPAAPRTVEQGADGIVWAATLPDDGPTGGFFRDRKPIPW